MADEDGSDAETERCGGPSEVIRLEGGARARHGAGCHATASRPRRRSLRPGLALAGAAFRRLGQSLRGDGRERAMASKKTPGAEVAEFW